MSERDEPGALDLCRCGDFRYQHTAMGCGVCRERLAQPRIRAEPRGDRVAEYRCQVNLAGVGRFGDVVEIPDDELHHWKEEIEIGRLVPVRDPMPVDEPAKDAPKK